MTRYAVVAFACLALATGAALAEEPSLSIQLNKLEPVDGGCRIYFVIENRGEAAYDELTVDLVTFDPAGIVGQRLLVELGPLRAAKTAVSSFDFAALECTAIDRILVNDVTSCRTAARPPDAGPPDAGPPDARPPDAGPPDARPPDAEPPNDCVGRIALSSLGAELLF